MRPKRSRAIERTQPTLLDIYAAIAMRELLIADIHKHDAILPKQGYSCNPETLALDAANIADALCQRLDRLNAYTP